KTGKITALDVPGQIAQAREFGIISETEAAQLRDYDRKVLELISVDDFDTHEMAAHASNEAAASEEDRGFGVASGQVA
ncbi:MAG TPA: acyl-CoA dehydrogenase domain-containing protein, partial [Steroidobacteraceae bacterium]|nr:acyl-CoA dehydrogenase domain-containing protein [Steroidobacteraceae bacterium]